MMKYQPSIMSYIAKSSLVIGAFAVATMFTLPVSAQVSCVGLEIADGAVPSSEPAPIPADFGVKDILDVSFRLLLPADLEGQHVVEMRVFTPDGSLYRSMSAPFAAPTWRGSSTVEVQDYPRPMRVLTAEANTGPRGTNQMVTMPFPVAGTDIVNRGIYGSWTVVAHVDYSDDPCTATVPFSLLATTPLGPGIFSDDFEVGNTSAWSGVQ